MLFASDNELKDMVTYLLSAPFTYQAVKYLQGEDQKQLQFARNELKQKMPVELQSQKYGPKSMSNQQQQQQQARTEMFPSMFESTSKKTYEYINEDAANMQKVANTLSVFPQNNAVSRTVQDLLSQNAPQIPQEQNATPNVIPNQVPQEAVQEQGGVQGELKKQASSSAKILSRSLERSQADGKRNPFIASKVNFTDKYANSKHLQSKYPHLKYTDSARNMAALGQGSKFNAFSGSVAYPTTVMTGTLLPPKNSTFSREGRMDVEDVMRYTLGSTRKGFQSVPKENPFVRVPANKKS